MASIFLRNTKFKPQISTGRGNSGKIVVRHRKCFKFKTSYNLKDFKRIFSFTNFMILKLMSESGTSGFIALIYYINFGIFSYILCSQNSKVGDKVSSFKFKSKDFTSYKNLTQSCSLSLLDCPLGANIFNLEFKTYSGGSITRSAGTSSVLLRKVKLKNGKEFACVKLPSGVPIYISALNSAVFGQSVSNKQHISIKGLSSKYLLVCGRRPEVRGVAMNPVDHPHGGGEGKTSGGRISVSIWGKLSKGGKTINFKKKKRRLLSTNHLERCIK